MLVGLTTQTSKKHTNKCVDGSTHYRIKVAKTNIGTSLGYLENGSIDGTTLNSLSSTYIIYCMHTEY